VLTRNGRVTVHRRHDHLADRGVVRPVDRWLGLGVGPGVPGVAGVPGVTRGVRRMMCLLNLHAGSFDHAAQCLGEAAHLRASKELVRRVVEAEGRAVGAAQARILALVKRRHVNSFDVLTHPLLFACLCVLGVTPLHLPRAPGVLGAHAAVRRVAPRRPGWLALVVRRATGVV